MSRKKTFAPLDQRRRGAFTARRTELLVDLSLHGPSTGLSIATRIGLHVNTVREHLGRLVAERFVTVSPDRRGSRGRPRVLYALCDRDGENILDTARVNSALAVDRAFGSVENRGAERALAPPGRALVVDHLDRHGFEPDDDPGASEEVTVRCPLTRTWETLGDRLCAAHAQILNQIVRQVDDPRSQVTYRSHERPGTCSVLVTPSTGMQDTSTLPGN